MKITKVIGWYQIVSGIIALIVLILGSIKQFNLLTIPLLIILFLMIIYVIYSGYQLINDPLKGIKYSFFAQLIQVVGFTIPGFLFVFTTSAFLSIFINELNSGISFMNTLVNLNIRFDRNINFFGFEIFPIPILILVLLILEGFKLEKK